MVAHELYRDDIISTIVDESFFESSGYCSIEMI